MLAGVGEKKGFTLLEILVALAIVGISFGVLFETLSQSKRLSWRSGEVVEACRVAHNLLANSEFVKNTLESKVVEGTIKDNSRWHYWAEVSDLELKDKEDSIVEIPSMVQLKLCVSRHENRSKRRFCITRWYRE